MNRGNRLTPALDVLILLIAFAGFLLNLLLFVRRYSDEAAAIAGCGGGDCEAVLASRWSTVFLVPVTVFGLLAYAGMMASVTRVFQRLLPVCIGAVTGAAAWFVFVQLFLLGRLCPWCVAAHGVALAAAFCAWLRLASVHGWRRSLGMLSFWSFAAFLALGLAQIYGPVPATHRVEPLPAGASGGRGMHDAAAPPRIGPARARHVMVEYFDYQCAACRTMAGYLDALMARHPDKIAVLCLPVPQESSCNPAAPVTGEHPGSCRTSRIAMAVWLANPARFSGFHHELFGVASAAEAEQHALRHVSKTELAAALADPRVEEWIRHGVRDWQSLSKSSPKLPKLIVRDRRVLHGLPSGEEDFIRVMEKELGL